MSADAVVPGRYNPQALNRFAYCVNNPLRFTDPGGHSFGISQIIRTMAMNNMMLESGITVNSYASQQQIANEILATKVTEFVRMSHPAIQMLKMLDSLIKLSGIDELETTSEELDPDAMSDGGEELDPNASKKTKKVKTGKSDKHINQDKVEVAKSKLDTLKDQYDSLSSKRMKTKADNKALKKLEKQIKHQKLKATGGKEGPHWNR